MKTDNGTVSLGRIENLKLFTEYERQLKRKYPCSHPAFKEENLEFSLCFEHLVKGVIYNFRMIAPNPPRNGDVECKVYLDNHPNKTMQFDESRKPMEMNVDNLITAATVLANQEN
jgi:hypothetical protein